MSSTFESVRAKARERHHRILLPESDDLRVLEAAHAVADQGLATPVLLGEPEAIRRHAHDLGMPLERIELMDLHDPVATARYHRWLIAANAPRALTERKLESVLADPIARACIALACGEVDGCVAGAANSTAEVLRRALRYVGRADHINTVSSFFIMLLQHWHPVEDVIVLADCALNVEPSVDELVDIACSTGESAQQLLGLEPRIGMLSFSTDNSARHPRVRKVRDAAARVRQRKPDWHVVGDVQLDAAVIPDILAQKAPAMAGALPCNVLIFPDLDAGNIGYKLMERFGGAKALGPILQGLKRPVNDLSRGCSASDIVDVITITAAQCEV